MSNNQKPLLICCILGDEILPDDIGIIMRIPSYTNQFFDGMPAKSVCVCCRCPNPLLLEGSGLSKLRYGTLITSQGTQGLNGVGVGAAKGSAIIWSLRVSFARY